MNVLLIGNGAREHALAEALARGGAALYAFVSANNPGIGALAETRIGEMDDVDAMVRYAQDSGAELAVIGPELPLAVGVADALQAQDIGCFGPEKELAQLETSKSFTRELLQKYGIDASPRFRIFASEKGLREFLQELGEYVIKPDGLTGGKGVRVKGEHFDATEEAMAYCREILAQHGRVVIEEKLVGEEFSLMSIADGNVVLDLPAVQDHKRAYEGDTGPNTGGMGSYSGADHLLPFLTGEDVQVAHAITVEVMEALKRETGKRYKGVMYGGFIVTKRGVKLIEYNARFGDPEAMNVLPILKTNFVDICKAVADGTLERIHLEFEQKATVCKYVVPEEYPGKSAPGKIQVPAMDAKTYYAAVDKREDGLYTTGSRSVAIVGIADTLAEAERQAEEGAQRVVGTLRHRKDIGTAALIQKRIGHVRQLHEVPV